MIEIILSKPVIKHNFISYFVFQYVCQDTLGPTVEHNVLILRTGMHVKNLATAALTYAIGPWAVELFQLLLRVGTLKFILKFVNRYTIQLQNNNEDCVALLFVLRRKCGLIGVNVSKICHKSYAIYFRTIFKNNYMYIEIDTAKFKRNIDSFLLKLSAA